MVELDGAPDSGADPEPVAGLESGPRKLSGCPRWPCTQVAPTTSLLFPRKNPLEVSPLPAPQSPAWAKS